MKYISFLIVMIIGLNTAQAQDKVEETKQKVKDRSENRLDNKIDNAIDGGLNKIEGLFKKKKKKGNKKKANRPSPTNATIQPVYSFGSNMKFQLTNYKKGDLSKANEMEFQYFFPKKATDLYLGMKMDAVNTNSAMQDMMNIVDQQNMLMFMNQGGAKFVTVMQLPTAEGEEEDFEQKFEKTGNTLEILGYTCEEYISETPEFKMKFWIAPTMKEQAKSMTNVFLSMNRSAKIQTASLPHPEMGMVLQMESVNLKTQDKLLMKATALNLDQASDFSTSSYKQLSINLNKGN